MSRAKRNPATSTIVVGVLGLAAVGAVLWYMTAKESAANQARAEAAVAKMKMMGAAAPARFVPPNDMVPAMTPAQSAAAAAQKAAQAAAARTSKALKAKALKAANDAKKQVNDMFMVF